MKGIKQPLTVLLSYLVIQALPGCSSDVILPSQPGVDIECESKDQCKNGQNCVSGQCVDLGTNGSDCVLDNDCLSGICKDGVCIESENGGTTDPGHKTECQNDGDCSGGTCVNGHCEDVVVDNSCTLDDDCRDGKLCHELTCKTPVQANGDCSAPDSFCVVGNCVGRICKVADGLADTDGDTISDAYDKCDVDTDNDTLVDCEDLDADGDTIPDAVEAGNGGDLSVKPVTSNMQFVYDFLSTDSDGNGLPDMYEGCPDPDFPYTGPDSPKPTKVCENPVDTDGDTTPDYRDLDNDEDSTFDFMEIVGVKTKTSPAVPGRKCDGVPCAEGTAANPWDSDGDTIPDYMDLDSDGDTISDYTEGHEDSDQDGVLDRYSLDSDGDTLPDAKEVGEDGKPLTFIDQAGRTIYCYQTVDCDLDSVKDGAEPVCNGVQGMLNPDTDGDGYLDASELSAGVYALENGLLNGASVSSAFEVMCNPELVVTDVFDFYFELPYGGEEKDDILEFIPKVSKLDLVFNVDTTGSMNRSITNVKTNIGNIIQQMRQIVSDTGFALVNFDDFPTSSYGSGSDYPFRVLGKVSTNQTVVSGYTQDTLFTTRNGQDIPESGTESLYHIITGAGTSWYQKDGIWPWSDKVLKSLPNNSNAAGTWGGVDFRSGTLPVIVHVTDAPSHDSDYNAYDTSWVPNPHYSSALLNQAKKTGTRIIQLGVGSSESTRRSQGLKWAKGSNAVVPVCAFGTSATQCMLGSNRTTPETIDGKTRQCALNYEGEYSEVASMISQGVDALVKYGTYDVSTRVEGLPIPGTSQNTSCFIKRVIAERYVAPPVEPEKSCNPVAKPTKVGGAVYNNGFSNFAPGTSNVNKDGAQLHFTVVAQNDNCVEPKEEAQTFSAYIDVINPTTGLVFGRRQVSIIVPGEIDQETVN